MLNYNELIDIIDRIVNGSYTPDDIVQLRESLNIAGNVLQFVSQDGKFNINIGQITGGEVHLGDFYQGADAQSIRNILLEVLSQNTRQIEIDFHQNIVQQENEQAIIQIIPSAYDEETWVGREELVFQLSQKLQGQCRILIITGITGVGKTTIAERMAMVELRPNYLNYQVINFDNGVGVQDFVSTAENLLNQMEEKVTADERKNFQWLQKRLLQKLQNRYYLVLMNSLEVLLKGKGDNDIARNEFEDKQWCNFFNGLLAMPKCRSRLIITSQVLPTQFDTRYQRFWHEEGLQGLNESEQFQLFQKLFQRHKKEIAPVSKIASYLKSMSKAYEGHPLIIQVIAGEILTKPFNGNVEAYWHKYSKEFEVIEPVVGHQLLQLTVKDRVRQSLQQLAEDIPHAYMLLCYSSVYRRAVPESFWLAMLDNFTEEDKAAALEALKLRCLVVEEGFTHTCQLLIRQHNLIRNVTYELFKKTSKQSLQWQNAHRKAVTIWSKAYEPQPEASNLDKVLGSLERVYHLCELGELEEARIITFTIPFGISAKEPLHKQLNIWGYYNKQASLYQQFLDLERDLAPKLKAFFLNGLGDAKFDLGQDREASDCYEKALAISHELENLQQEGIALQGLGKVFCMNKDYQNAINNFHKSLIIAKKINNKEQIGISLLNIGNVYQDLQKNKIAIKYYLNSLEISTQIHDQRVNAKALLCLGYSYVYLKRYEKAISYLHQSLENFNNNKNYIEEREVSFALGKAYQLSERFEESKKYYEYGLSINEEPCDLEIESRVIRELGYICYYYLDGKLQQSARYYERYLNLIEIDDYQERADSLLMLGAIYYYLKQFYKSLNSYNKLFNEIVEIPGDIALRLRGIVLCNLGLIYNELRQYKRAIFYSEKALKIFNHNHDRIGTRAVLANLGVSFREQCQYEKAIEYFKQAIIINDEPGYNFKKGVILRDLGISYRRLGIKENLSYYLNKSFDSLQQSLEILKHLKPQFEYDKTLKELKFPSEIIQDTTIDTINNTNF